MDVLPSHWQMVAGVIEEAMMNFLGGNTPPPSSHHIYFSPNASHNSHIYGTCDSRFKNTGIRN